MLLSFERKSALSLGCHRRSLLYEESMTLTTKPRSSTEVPRNAILIERIRFSYLMNNLRCLRTPFY